MKNMHSQCTSDSVMVAKKLKNASAGSESNTKGSLQDGGTQQNMSEDRTGNDCVRGMESPHNSDMSYPPASGGQNSDNYGKMNDMSGPQMPNFNSSYIRGNFNMTDQQHGGMGNPSTGSEFPQQNSQYNHPFAQQNMRGTNFPPGSGMPRGTSAPTRPGMGANSMGMIPPNYNPNQQQRPFMSGPSIQQQGGSTPTLNQLLQNPNPTSRYQSGYGDYGMNQPKGGPENMNSQSFSSQGWNQQRPGNPYQSQMQGGGQPFRNQGPVVFDGNRRHMPSGYPQQPGGQYPNQNQFSPGSPQHYPGSQPRMAGQPYSQMSGSSSSYGQPSAQGAQSFGGQQQQQQVTQNHHHQPQPGLPSQQGPGHHPRSSYHSPPSSQPSHSHFLPHQQPPSSSSSAATPHSPSPGQPAPDKPRDDAVTSTASSARHGKGTPDSSDSPSLPSSNNQHLQTNSSQDSVSGAGSSDDLNSDSNSTGTNSRPTPTPTPTSTPGPHSGAPLRAVPSPAGSSGSRSNTPASVTGGNNSGSPMPPRPPSNQIDGPQGRIQSPMANQQGYPGQGPSMMPPPMGPNQMMYPGANKLASNMMGPNTMGNFNSQYPNQPQGNYRGMPGMGGYGNQHSSFNGPSMSSQYNNYGSNMGGMTRSMNQYSSQYPPSSNAAMNSAGYNSQFANYVPQTTMTSSHNSSQSSQNAPQPSPASTQNVPTSTIGSSTIGSSTIGSSTIGSSTSGSSTSGSSTSPQPSRVPSPRPKGAQAAAQAAMMAAANQSAGKPPYSSSGRSRSPSGANSSSQPVTPPPGQNQSTPDQQPPPAKASQQQQQGQHGSMQSPQGSNSGQQSSPGHHGLQSQPLHQPGLPSSGDSGPMPRASQSGPQHHQSPTPPSGPQQQHPQVQPHPGMPSSQQPHSMPHPSQGPPHQSHPGMPPSGPPHMQGPGGPNHPPPHPHRMYGPGHYPQHPQQHPGNHMNYNHNAAAMNQMGNQVPPNNNSGESSMPPYNNSVDSAGPGPGQPHYGPMGGPGGGPSGMGPMGSRHPSPNDMTNTHGMSGGCVSVSPNMRPPNSMAPNSMSSNSMPVNSTNMCDMNNGIPPNAMAPSSMNMGHGSMRSSHYPPQGPDMSQPAAGMHGVRPGVPASGDDVSDMDCKPAISLATTIAGDSSTSVTQSINTPLTNAMETKPTMSLPGSRLMGPPPPRTTLTPSQIDSSSQDSHSSSQDSDSDKSRVKIDKIENLSHPPTPASQVVPSPATSMHDELENISSPSWPGTPKPEKSEKAEKATPFNEVFNRQLEFGTEPDRRMFLERLFMFMTDKACPITAMPMISKQPIDLYKLYHLVKAKGGMVDVTKNKKWRDVSGALNIGSSSSAGFTLRKNYAKYIFPLECKFDRGDVDPAPILASLETPSKSKESKKSQQAATAAQPMQDPFRGGQQGYGNFGGNMRHPQMGNAEMHGPMMPPNVSMMPNNMHYEQGGMMPNSNMMPNSMMPNNNMAMGPNSMGSGGMMPGHGGMNNSNMMPNQNMPNQNMPSGGAMPPSAMMPQTPSRTIGPTAGDSISVQNPFADSPNHMASQYQQRHGMAPNMPPYAQQQGSAGPGHNSSYPGFGNRSGAVSGGYPTSTMSQGSHPNDSSRMNSTSNSNSSNDSFPSAGENSHGSSSSAPAPNNLQGPNNLSGPPGGSYGNQPYPNRGSGAPPSAPLQPFSQPQGPRQTASPAPGVPKSTAQPPSQVTPAPQPSPAPSAEPPSEPSARSEPSHPTPPPPAMMKATPPQLHSTDSNSSTGSQGLRPPSQPGPVPPSSQEPPQPPAQMYPGPYSGPTPQQPPTTQVESFSQQSSQQPQMPMMSPAGSHGNQMTQVPFSGMSQHGQSYTQGPRPYPQGPQGPQGPRPQGPQGPQDPSSGGSGGYPGYHSQPGPGSGSYAMSKPSHGPQYGPQPYTPTKSYPEHRRDGYMMPPGGYNQGMTSYCDRSAMSGGQYGVYGSSSYSPRSQSDMMPAEMMSQSQPAQRHGSSNAMAFNPNMYKRPHLPHSPMHPSHQMSPQRLDRRAYMPSAKLQKGGPPMHRPPIEAKKEIVFPAGSVETTRAHLLKRKKLKHKDIGSTDPWRLMMALKSGLLVESTWALDTLSILLYDDSMVAWFGLQHLPGLIEVLLEHFRRCLVKIFNSDFNEMEIGAERKKELDVRRGDESLFELADEDGEMELPQCTPQPGRDGKMPDVDEENEEESEEQPEKTQPEVKLKLWKLCTSVPDPEKLKEPRNFSQKTRDGKIIKVEEGSHDEWMLKKKHWDIYDDFDSSTFVWQLGRGNATNHIITHMENKNSADFFRKCFFKRTVSKDNEKSSGTGNIIELKEENDRVLDSSPVNPEEDKFDGSSPMPTLPQVGCSPKCDSVRSPCSDCIDSPVTDTKPSVPNIKTEPLDDCDKESGAEIKTEAKQKAMDVDLVKQEPCELTKAKSPADSLEGESESTDSNPDAAKEEDLTHISTSRQLNDLKRKWTETEEEGESYQRDDMPFMLLPEALEEVSKRCVCISNIFRSLSFIPGNDVELSRHPGLMLVLGRLLLLHHTHPKRNPEHHKFDREVEQETGDSTEDSKREWWWDTLDALRENTLVTIANISGQVNLINYPEEICLPILDGLLHWAVCPSAYAQDPMPTMSSNSVLSPHRLVLEALCKLCITESNVDLVLATPPFSRIVQLLGNLVQMISNQGDQVMREFGIVLLSSLVQGEPSAARAVALHHPSISLLLNFIETAESQALNIANTHAHGITLLQENPEMMGTSLDMLRRTACVLRALSEVPDNRNLFQHHQHRLLHLVMSQILDHKVASILSDVLHNCAELS